ncbi:transcription initiation factor TFIID component TAF4 family-domain-containing protein [Blyttiomyces helicus]|uniref:Transcription initiation factor TFIID subunit 4 n=1 Tax=Blyttiomyces helicus TaxID=388810 RepID=A0A4P9WMX0_9FUNG|nr:transcription initiation factor TFIID component TAF4 family-domain-containing protein [Blyttiomyces helicus]|eukprot:RKO92096.1 transcription initiation factor TFIID component TAF4 family-domain-containing protein [Blyttiomyces helicus]
MLNRRASFQASTEDPPSPFPPIGAASTPSETVDTPVDNDAPEDEEDPIDEDEALSSFFDAPSPPPSATTPAPLPPPAAQVLSQPPSSASLLPHPRLSPAPQPSATSLPVQPPPAYRPPSNVALSQPPQTQAALASSQKQQQPYPSQHPLHNPSRPVHHHQTSHLQQQQQQQQQRQSPRPHHPVNPYAAPPYPQMMHPQQPPPALPDWFLPLCSRRSTPYAAREWHLSPDAAAAATTAGDVRNGRERSGGYRNGGEWLAEELRGVGVDRELWRESGESRLLGMDLRKFALGASAANLVPFAARRYGSRVSFANVDAQRCRNSVSERRGLHRIGNAWEPTAKDRLLTLLLALASVAAHLFATSSVSAQNQSAAPLPPPPPPSPFTSGSAPAPTYALPPAPGSTSFSGPPGASVTAPKGAGAASARLAWEDPAGTLDIDVMADVANYGGFDMKEEENRMTEMFSKSTSYPPGLDRTRDQKFLNMAALKRIVEEIASSQGLSDVSPDFFSHLALATEERMRNLSEQMVKASKHRAGVLHEQFLAIERERQLAGHPDALTLTVGVGADVSRTLAAIERLDRDRCAALKEEYGIVDAPIDPDAGPAGAFGAALGDDGKKKRRRPTARRDETEAVKTKHLNTTALLAAAGGKKAMPSWMTASGVLGPGGTVGTTPAPSLTSASSSAGGGYGDPAMRVFPRRRKDDGGGGGELHDGGFIPRRGVSRKVTVKDVLFCLEKEHGMAKGNTAYRWWVETT